MTIRQAKKLLSWIAGILVAGTTFSLVLKQAIPGMSDSSQQELWRIASALHAPGDTTTQTVATSSAATAWTIRTAIAHLLAKGYTETQILHRIELQYGPSVLADPSWQGFGLFVWVLPIISLCIVAAIAFLYVTRSRAVHATHVDRKTDHLDAPNLTDDDRAAWKQFL